jgi:hypothetical protein
MYVVECFFICQLFTSVLKYLTLSIHTVVGIKPHALLTLELDGVEWLLCAAAVVPPGTEHTILFEWKGGWATELTSTWCWRNILVPAGSWMLVIQPETSHFTDEVVQRVSSHWGQEFFCLTLCPVGLRGFFSEGQLAGGEADSIVSVQIISTPPYT